MPELALTVGLVQILLGGALGDSFALALGLAVIRLTRGVARPVRPASWSSSASPPYSGGAQHWCGNASVWLPSGDP